MTLGDYNADAICRVLGLRSFVDPTWPVITLRIVLKPSFHPEVVITLAPTKEHVAVSVVAASRQIYSVEVFQRVDTFTEQCSVDASIFAELVNAFSASIVESTAPKNVVCCDGMSIEACLGKDGTAERLDAHVAVNESAKGLVERLLKSAWPLCKSAQVKNALSDTAFYIDLRLPKTQPDASSVTRVNLMVLGPTEDRSEILTQLERHSKKPKPPET